MKSAQSYSTIAAEELDREVLRLMEEGNFDDLDDARFTRLALREFEYQFASCTPYRLFCQSQNKSPTNVSHWTEIPPVPTQAFKEAVISTCSVEGAVQVFKTSGTSSQGTKPGVVYRDEGGALLWRESGLRSYKQYVLPERDRILFYSLVPTVEQLPYASIAHHMEILIDRYGNPGSRSFFTSERFDMDALAIALREAEQQRSAVLINGATFTFVHFYDWCEKQQLRFNLPQGSRILHGSGYKGRSRELTKDEFLENTFEVLDIPEDHNVDVLGMTELGSQFYDNVLRNQVRGIKDIRYKAHLPWTRTRVVHPETLEMMPAGEVGILVHCDLSLRCNVIAVQTDDLGVEVGKGFEILGRVSGAEARGCNLTLQDMLEPTDG